MHHYKVCDFWIQRKLYQMSIICHTPRTGHRIPMIVPGCNFANDNVSKAWVVSQVKL